LAHSYVASYDLGTSSVKAVVVDFRGQVVASGSAGYSLLTPHPGWVEQDPASYWDAVCRATKQVLQSAGISPGDVGGIVFGTQWKGIIPLDRQDNVLHNAIIWLDGRAEEQAAELNRRMNTTEFCNKDYWPKLMWLKAKLPEIYEKTACFLEVNAFLKFKATGRKVVDLTNSFTRSVDRELQAYYDKVLAAAELDPDRFPPLVMPTEAVGGLTETAAGELGLCAGTTVFGGCGDIPAIAIGAGCSRLSSSHIYLGSSSWLALVAPKREWGVGELHQSFDEGKELVLYGMQSACMTLNWALDQFYHVEKEILKGDIFRFVDEEIAPIEPGSSNLLATPWLHGERPPLSEKAKAVFLNVASRHDRRHFIHALREGVSYHLRWKMNIFRKETGQALDSIRMVGGGTSSSHWMQMMANVLQIPVQVPSNAPHAGAIGTAYCALIGLGLCQNYEQADQMIGIERTFAPDRAHRATYDMLFDVYQGIYPALEGLFTILNG